MQITSNNTQQTENGLFIEHKMYFMWLFMRNMDLDVYGCDDSIMDETKQKDLKKKIKRDLAWVLNHQIAASDLSVWYS